MALGRLDIIIAADTAQIRKDMSSAVGILKSSSAEMSAYAKKATDEISSSFGLLKGVIAGGIFVEVTREAIKMADTFKLIEGRLNLVTNSYQELANAQKSLFTISQNTRQSIESTTDLYTRIARSTQELGKSQGDMLTVTEAINKSFIISGSSADSAKAAIIQLGQGFASGTLRGEELNSVLEQAPRLAEAIAKGMGKSIGQLRQLGTDGKLTADEVFKAIQNQAKNIGDEFSKMPMIVEQSVLTVKNSITNLIGEMDKATGATQALSDSIRDMSKWIDSNSTDLVAIGQFAYATISRTIDVFNLLWESIENTVQIVIGHISSLVYTSLELLLTMMTKIVEGLNTLGIASDNSLVTAKEHLKIVNDQVLNANKLIADSYKEIDDAIVKLSPTIEDRIDGYNKLKKAAIDAKNAESDILKTELPDRFTRLSKEEDKKYWEDLFDIQKKQYEDGIKNYNEKIQTTIQGLEKQLDIKKQIKNLDIESALRVEKISKPEAEYLKEINEIHAEIAKNQASIKLLATKDYSLDKSQKVADLLKINDLQKEDELLKRKLIAADERRQATIKAVNDELKSSIMSLDMSDIDKQYLSLSKEVANLVKDGADLKLVGEYATTIANQLAREDAYNHLQKELEIRKDTIELTMYGSEKETALESVRHEEVLANLQRELETRKVNYDEYLKLMNLEMKRHAQNADELRKFMLSAFDNIEKALDSNFFDAMQGKFKSFGDWLKSFFKNIGNSIAQGLSRTLAGGIVNSLRSSLFSNMGTGLTLGSLAVGSAVSASEISTIMNSGGTFDSATNTITTSGGSKIGVGSDGGGTVKSTGSDVMNLVNIVSTLKTAYTVATTGISNSIMAGFTGVSDALAGAGMWGASAGISNFGYGFANPFSYGVGNGAFGSTMAGGALSAGLIGGAVGYGTGWLGDKLFGANTYASMGGLAGGALGGIGASLGMFGGPVGIIAGSLIGSALGGIFGKKKETDSGIQFFKNLDSLDTLSNETVRAYQDWEKKGWFSKSSGTELSDLSSSQMKQIEAVFDTYDYLLVQLGDSDKIFLEAGKYSKDTFQDALAKNFIKAFTDIDQSVDSTIYQAWKDYAESIDKTVTEAITSSISAFVSSSRDFEKWSLERQGKTLESLQKQSQWLTADFSNLANMLGATDVTVENYTQKYSEAIKNSFDPDTITKWQNLGTALRSATDASDSLKNALLTQINAELTAWKSALGSIQSAIDNISPTFKSLDELKNSTVTIDNYSTLLSQLEATRQNEINTLTTAANARIEQLNNEKSLFQNLSSFIDELNLKLLGSNVTSDYFFSELDKAKETLKNGGVVDTSKLTASANSYLDSALQNSTSQLEYFRELAKVKDGIGSLGSMVTGGTLESVEAAIKTEEQTLASKLDALNQTALAILNGWKGTATSSIADLTNRQNIVKNNLLDQWVTNKDGTQTYQSTLGAVANRDTVTDNFSVATTQGEKNSISAGVELYNYVQAYGEAEGYAKAAEYGLSKSAAEGLYWIGNAYDGAHATGLDYVPYDDYKAILHKGERVQTASEVQKDAIITELKNDISDLKKIFEKNAADTSRIMRAVEMIQFDTKGNMMVNGAVA